jgi:ankyrin repeat protein
MHEAVWRGNVEIVNHLFDEYSCPLDIRSSAQHTPLHIAATQGNVEMIKLLTERGANMELVNEKGLTPILAGVSTGKLDSLLVLKWKGANTSFTDEQGSGIAHYAA